MLKSRFIHSLRFRKVKENDFMNNEKIPERAAGDRSSLINVMEFTVDSVCRLADTNSVLGTPIETNGMTIIPVSKLSVGFAGGGADVTDAARRKKQNPAGAGAKVTLTPLTFLVINGNDVHTLCVNAPANTSTAASAVIDAVAAQIKPLLEERRQKKQKNV